MQEGIKYQRLLIKRFIKLFCVFSTLNFSFFKNFNRYVNNFKIRPPKRLTPNRPAPDIPQFFPEITSPLPTVENLSTEKSHCKVPEKNQQMNLDGEIWKNGIERLGPLVAPLIKYAKTSVTVRNRSIFGGIRKDKN